MREFVVARDKTGLRLVTVFREGEDSALAFQFGLDACEELLIGLEERGGGSS